MEALVDSQTGEIIVAKPDGAVWAERECCELQLVEFAVQDDDDRKIARYLTMKAASGEPTPNYATPFTEIDDKGKRQVRKRLAFTAEISGGTLAKIKDRRHREPIIRASRIRQVKD